MKTTVLKIDRRHPEKEKLEAAAAVLRSGGVVVIPTDTVYGLAASAFNAAAQKKIYRLKGRSYRKPLIVMPPDPEALGALAEIPERARRIMRNFWPGPLTLVLCATPLGKMVMGGRGDLGARIPDNAVVRALLARCGFPLLTTSANPSSQPSAKDARAAAEYFRDRVDLILDGGPGEIGRESTVVDITHFHGVVVREGCLSSKRLLEYIV